jgi:hypothetical protein
MLHGVPGPCLYVDGVWDSTTAFSDAKGVDGKRYFVRGFYGRTVVLCMHFRIELGCNHEAPI